MSLIISIRRDVNAIFEHTQTATSTLEILLAYPGFHARQFHRLTHALFRWHTQVLPRLVSHISCFLSALKSISGPRSGVLY